MSVLSAGEYCRALTTAPPQSSVFAVTPPLESYASDVPVVLGLAGDYQRRNATMALQLCAAWLRQKGGEVGRRGQEETETNKKKKKREKKEKGKERGPGSGAYVGLSFSCFSLQAADVTVSEERIEGIPVAQPFHLTRPYLDGLALAKWPGRSQVRKERKREKRRRGRTRVHFFHGLLMILSSGDSEGKHHVLCRRRTHI